MDIRTKTTPIITTPQSALMIDIRYCGHFDSTEIKEKVNEYYWMPQSSCVIASKRTEHITSDERPEDFWSDNTRDW